MSPFWGLAFVSGEVFVKLNSTDETCRKLITVGGANYTELLNASRTCGPAGEVKKRVAEDLSAVFFQAGLEWVKHDNETIVVETEDGTFEIPVSEAKWQEQSYCWARGCECEQAKHPKGRAVLFTLLAVAIVAIFWDSARLGWQKLQGKKPEKYVQCKKGHKVEEGSKVQRTHLCDMCGKGGTSYQCSNGCPYDLCKPCYKTAKKKVKGELEAWYEKNPEEKAKEEERKKSKKNKTDGDDSDVNKDSNKAESEGESTKAKSDGDKEAESTGGKTESEGKDESGKEDSKGDSSKEEEE